MSEPCNLPLTAASECRPSLPMTHGDPRMSNVKQTIQSPTLHPVYIQRLSHRTTCKTSFSNSLLASDHPSKSETRIESSLSLKRTQSVVAIQFLDLSRHLLSF